MTNTNPAVAITSETDFISRSFTQNLLCAWITEKNQANLDLNQVLAQSSAATTTRMIKNAVEA